MPEAQVRLRPITEADLPDYLAWLNDPEVTQFTHIEGPLTLEDEREWFQRVSDPDSGIRNWGIEVDGRHIGNCALHIHESGEMAGFAIMIGDKTQWNTGYGTAALREVLRIGFEEMGLQRVHLTALGGNTRGIRCYEKCGFRHEGLQRRHFLKRGKWEDVVCMGILREEWERLTASLCPGSDTVAIRSYRPFDYEQVIAIWREAWGDGRPGDAPAALAYHEAHDPGPFLVAELDGRVVGTVLASWDGRWAWVTRLAVHVDYRRRGLARLLMAEVEQRLVALGAPFAALLVGAENAGATGLYRALGYQCHDHVAYFSKALTGEDENCCEH